MQIFIDAEGNANIVTPQHIYQGSNISQINVISLAFTPQTTLQIAFVLPDGTTTNYYPMSFLYSSTANYYQYTIQQAFTALSGQASIALLATDSQTQQQTSQLIPFTIEPSVLPTLPDTPSQDEWTTLLQYVQQNSSNIANLQTIISDIESIANTANTNASQAVETAIQALSTAQQAEQTANKLANSIAQANSTASQANKTANDAKTTAEQALKQVVEKQGTVAYVGGTYVPTLDFTDNPQTQLTQNANAIAANTADIETNKANIETNTTNISANSENIKNIKAGASNVLVQTSKNLVSNQLNGYVRIATTNNFGVVKIFGFLGTIPYPSFEFDLNFSGADVIITQQHNSTNIKKVILDGQDLILYIETNTNDTTQTLFVNYIFYNNSLVPSITRLSDYTPSESAIIFTSSTTGFQTENAKISNLVAEMLNGAAPVNINDFLSNIGESGYQKLPSGLIIQWGKVGAYSQNGNTTQTFSVTLPIAFPTRYLSATAQLGSVDISGTSTNYEYYAGVSANLTTLTIAVRWQSQYTNSIYWIAIGY